MDTGFECSCHGTIFPTAAAFSAHVHENDEPKPQVAEPAQAESIMPEMERSTDADYDWHKVYYKCTNKGCGATTYELVYGDAPPTPVLNCYKCHAGFKMDQAQMMQTNTGMFIVPAAQVPTRVQ